MILLHVAQRRVQGSKRIDSGPQQSPNFNKLLKSPRIDSMEPIPPVCVAWRAGTTTLFLFGS
jgi:hypothetical protein